MCITDTTKSPTFDPSEQTGKRICSSACETTQAKYRDATRRCPSRRSLVRVQNTSFIYDLHR